MDRRTQILQTAGQLFRERGYHGTSMRDIAGRLELRGSSLYAHIGSKEELLWGIVNEAADAFLASAESTDAILSPKERLGALVRGHFAVIAKELPHATVFFHEWRGLPQPMRTQIMKRRDAYEAHFTSTIRAGMDAGEFEVADIKLATLFVLSSLNWSYHWLDPDGRLNIDELATRYTSLILKGLGGCE